MRGALSDDHDFATTVGIIPADAGSTVPQENIIILGEDHPRGCGERQSRDLRVRLRLGSSPRMRGARFANAIFPHRRGIIPADAGSTR